MELHAGDTLVVQTQWESLTRLKSDRNFVIVTSDYPQEELRPQKVGWALLFFNSINVDFIFTSTFIIMSFSWQ